MAQENNSTQWILGGALLLIGLFVIIALVLTRSQAAGTLVSVSNVAPVIDTNKVCTGWGVDPSACSNVADLTLTAGADTNFTFAGTLHDDNGIGDIDSFGIYWYRSDLAWTCIVAAHDVASCIGADLINFYDFDCTITPLTATAGEYFCEFSLDYWADSTNGAKSNYPLLDFKAYAEAFDGAAYSAENIVTHEINSLLAISTPASIDYGTLANGAASATGVSFTITNAGNVDADTENSGTAMTCTFGSIPAANQVFDVITGTYAEIAAAGVALSTTPTSYTEVVLPQRTTASAAAGEDIIYWAITIPSTGASGSCSGTNTLTAI